jgi:hypothetical protein
MRYKGGEPPLMIYTTLRAAMICQACGLDKHKRPLTAFVLGEAIRCYTEKAKRWPFRYGKKESDMRRVTQYTAEA